MEGAVLTSRSVVRGVCTYFVVQTHKLVEPSHVTVNSHLFDGVGTETDHLFDGARGLHSDATLKSDCRATIAALNGK